MSDYKKCPYCGEDILAVAQKCKHCGEWLKESPVKTLETDVHNSINEKVVINSHICVIEDTGLTHGLFKNEYFKTKPTTLQKIYPKRWLLDEFFVKNGDIIVITRNGNKLSAPIIEVEVEYATIDNYNDKLFTLKYNNKKLTFMELPNMLSNEEWTHIEEILESIPNYGLSTIGAIIKTICITMGIIWLVILAFWLVPKYSSI